MSKQQVQLKEKELSIEDLKNTDHVGFIDKDGNKGYSYLLPLGIQLLCQQGAGSYGNGDRNIQDAFKNVSKYCHDGAQIVTVFKFDTGLELYQWLAEG